MIRADTVVAKKSHAVCQCLVVSRDHPPFACGNMFNRMKAEGIEGGQGANGLIIVSSTKRMARISNKSKIIANRDLFKNIIVTRLPGIVHRNDRLCFR